MPGPDRGGPVAPHARPSPLALALALALLAAAATGCAPSRPTIRTGDLLFQDLDCGATCDAIEGVTVGVRGARLSHVGVADRDADGRVFVIEAYDGVTRTPLAEFLARTGGRFVLGRLRAPWQDVARRAAAEARRRVGHAYDPLFRPGDDRYYCSELVWEAFRDANGGVPLFPLAPMDFGDPEGRRDPWWAVWTAYFAERGAPVPAGEPGTNPGAISRASEVEILHFDP